MTFHASTESPASVVPAGVLNPAFEDPEPRHFHIGTPEIVVLAVGAAAIGGLGVWLRLRAGGNPQNRVSHRIDELRHRLNELADQLAGYAARTQGPDCDAGEM